MTASRRHGRRTRTQRLRVGTVAQAINLELRRVGCHCKPELELTTLADHVHVMSIQHDPWCVVVHDPAEN